MKTKRAIKLAGGRQQLADLFGVTYLNTYRWNPSLPKFRVFQLRVLRPKWFILKGGPT